MCEELTRCKTLLLDALSPECPHSPESRLVVETATAILSKAYTILTSSTPNTAIGTTKTSSIDFATEADVAIEEDAIATIRAAFPHALFVGEEGSDGIMPSRSEIEAEGAMTWVVDPVDGTTNYAHGFPFVAVSIAMLREGVPVFGAVLAPFLARSVYLGWVGVGMAVTGFDNLITCGDDGPGLVVRTDPGECVFIVGYSYDRSENAISAHQATEAALVGGPNPCRGIRNVGCAVMAITLVAMGGADAYFLAGLHAWDMAAPAVFAAIRGVHISGLDGSPFDLWARHVLVASNPELASTLISSAIVLPSPLPPPDLV